MANRMQLISGLPSGYKNQDVNEAIANLKDISQMLNTLGQIQAAVGGLSMDYLAGVTFEARARLDNFISIVESTNVQPT